MDLHLFDFPARILCIDGFFDLERSNAILRECIACREWFSPARVFGRDGTVKTSSDFRQNEVLYVGDLFRDNQQASSIIRNFSLMRHAPAYRRIWQALSGFELIPEANWSELVVSRYGPGSFYQKHTDTDPKHLGHRLMTVVYYINREPQRFSGGSIVFHQEGRELRIPTMHNRAVVFPSQVVHEVEPVEMGDCDWTEGRFSINCWLGFSGAY